MGPNSLKKHVFLTGYMGSGKSTVGAILANSNARPFYDLDKEIEKEDLLSISEIFRLRGEEYFRILESEVLNRLVIHSNPAVFALGGGTLTRADNYEFILNHGVLIYLEASVSVLVKRLENEITSRPIISNYKGNELRKFIETHLNSRLGDYQKSNYIINTDQLSISQIVDKLIKITTST